MNASQSFWRGAAITALSLGVNAVVGAPGEGAGARGRRGADAAVRLPEAVVYDRSEDSPAPVHFRHWTHVALAGGSCLDCLPEPFRLLTPTREGRHERMDAGGGCGACHDGARAFATVDGAACLLCHGDESPAAALPDGIGERLLGSSALAANESSPGTVHFDHSVHLSVAATCSSCHPELFPMTTAGAPLSKDELLAGASCGRCHDGELAFGVDDEGCERCHAGEDP